MIMVGFVVRYPIAPLPRVSLYMCRFLLSVPLAIGRASSPPLLKPRIILVNDIAYNPNTFDVAC